MNLPKTKILSLADIEALQPQLEHVNFFEKEYAIKTQTIVLGQEKRQLFLLTTNNFPLLHAQVLDRLKAQDYSYQVRYTDTPWFDRALLRYDQLAKQVSEHEEKWHHEHSVRGHEAVLLLKEIFAKRTEYTAENEFLNDLLRLSYQAGASDLHFQSEEIGVVLRLRRDGLLETVCIFSHVEFLKYMMKLKFMAGVRMNVETESQDGRMDFEVEQADKKIKIDIRVSIMPWLRGESLVLRFLDSSKGLLTLDQIGTQPFQQQLIKQYLNKNFGMILVCGPTGSGKTTTVYSLINMINDPSKKIITLEDPVEYELPGIEQSQINERKGYTFEAGLKGVLRHDPDIIMVWEIRTLEWAEMAINAALTGHLVISTLHTNSALESIARLLNMWVKPYMLASALTMVVGQRLARRVANSEQKPVSTLMDTKIHALIEHLPESLRSSLQYNGSLPVAVGEDPYKWRIALQEVAVITDKLKHAILAEETYETLRKIAHQEWFVSIDQDALMKVIQGKTTMEEVERVL